MLCPLSIALRGVELRSLDFGGESLKVGVDDVRGWQLLVCGFERSACFYLLPASPPVQLSGRSHDTLACGLLADPPLCSHEGSAHRSACGHCKRSGRGAGD